MDGLLKNKVVVITGAGSGVGRESTILFARHGAKVLALDIDGAATEAAAETARGEGGTVEAQRCDVTDGEGMKAAVAFAVERFGRLDVMFNNAGVTSSGSVADFLDGTMADLLRLTEINVGGVLNGVRAAVPQFRAQGGGGVIVNTASLAGLISYGNPVYSATKGAVTTLTRSIALRYAAEGIRVNAVCPAAMMTNFGMAEGFNRTPEIERYSASLFPIGRNIEAIECANAALFLASDLSSALTGVNLPVDGGISAGIKV